jgi:hypothetical protein
MSPRARARNMNVLDSLSTPYSAVLPPGRISHDCLGLAPVFMNADLNARCSGICGKGPEFAACSPLLLVSPPHAEHIRGFSDPVTGPGEADNSSSFRQFATRCQIPWLISLAQDTRIVQYVPICTNSSLLPMFDSSTQENGLVNLCFDSSILLNVSEYLRISSY